MQTQLNDGNVSKSPINLLDALSGNSSSPDQARRMTITVEGEAMDVIQSVQEAARKHSGTRLSAKEVAAALILEGHKSLMDRRNALRVE